MVRCEGHSQVRLRYFPFRFLAKMWKSLLAINFIIIARKAPYLGCLGSKLFPRTAGIHGLYWTFFLFLLVASTSVGASPPLDLKLYTRGGNFAPGDTIDLALEGVNSSNYNLTLATASYKVTYLYVLEIFSAERRVQPEVTIYQPLAPSQHPTPDRTYKYFHWSWRIPVAWMAPPGYYTFYITIRDPQGNIVGAAQHSILISYIPPLARFSSSVYASLTSWLSFSFPFLSLGAIISALLFIWRRKSLLRRLRAISLTGRYLSVVDRYLSLSLIHRYLSLAAVVSLLVGFSAALALQSAGMGWAGAITLIFFVGYCAVVSRRTPRYFSRILLGKLFGAKFKEMAKKLEQNPPSVFMGSSYILLMVITAVVLSASLGFVETARAMETATVLASHIFLLVVFTILAQILWNVYVSNKSLSRS